VVQGDVRGQAAEDLLDSYGAERKAHVRELTTRIKGVGAVICERDPARARQRDAQLLAACNGVVTDTPRQDILPRLDAGLLAATASTGRGTLFPQPRMRTSGALMDHAFGCGWRLVVASTPAVPPDAPPGLRIVDLARTPEAEGVAAEWMRRHSCAAALVRPDHYVFGTAADAEDSAALVREWRTRLSYREPQLAVC
jgi:3-(3-hydroxy-phenyl)propionate hydroxylase